MLRGVSIRGPPEVVPGLLNFGSDTYFPWSVLMLQRKSSLLYDSHLFFFLLNPVN